MNREHVSVSKLESTLVRLMAVSCVLLMIQPCFAAWRSPDFNDWAEFGTGATIPVAWGDFDNDGDLDLAVGNYGEANELYVNDGNGGFDLVPEFGAGATFAIVWGDYDNDGDLDAAVGNSGPNYLYTNNGDGTFDGVEEFGGDTTIAMAWGDFDNDGDLDLAVGNGILGSDQQNYLYLNVGGGTFFAVPKFGVGMTDSLAWGDCDGDGDLDLAVGNGGYVDAVEQQNYLYVHTVGTSFTQVPQFGMGNTAAVA